ncbi:MAG: nucleotide sugar dehydrogenase [Gammaproteobacteria bacterium]|nr:nucleotide sugar dehydrogenase [Gammaproteobacteria bacterium]
MLNLDQANIAVVGLGYVGLPLVIEFATKYPSLGFDINQQRVGELKNSVDMTREVSTEDFKRATQITFTSSVNDLAQCNTYIVTVPTPIDEHKKPNLGPLIAASKTIAAVIKKGDVVIYESTVYPGATEEICIPVIERESGLTYNTDFYAGYSPERINPGDKLHSLTSIIKVTSGSTEETADYVDDLYASIITAGTHRASSIMVAEAAKIIENTQRDLNIALINELAMIFEKLNIDTEEVLAAAETKWNFLPFRPGLVGGHCIGVDPYYLTHKAQAIGYHPEVILAGRRINDQMGEHIAGRVIKLMVKNAINIVGAKILILGLAFKENCPDIRNTKVVDVIHALENYHVAVDVFDPWVSPDEAKYEYDIELLSAPTQGSYDAVILAVAHDEFKDISIFEKLTKSNHVIFDVKHVFPTDQVDGRL